MKLPSLLIVLLSPVLWVPPLSGQEFSMSPTEKELLQLVNAEREKEKLPPLAADPLLFQAARDYSTRLAAAGREKFGHTLDGTTPPERVKKTGYRGSMIGENIAWGTRTPAEAMDVWMNSEGHRKNILSASYDQIGLGIARGEDGALYWTQVFGRGAGGPTPPPIRPRPGPEQTPPEKPRPDSKPGPVVRHRLTAEAREVTLNTRLNEGQKYTIEIESADFDPALRIDDGDGRTLTGVSGGGTGLRRAYVVFQPPATGPYRLVVSSRSEGTGEFALSIRAE